MGRGGGIGGRVGILIRVVKLFAFMAISQSRWPMNGLDGKSSPLGMLALPPNDAPSLLFLIIVMLYELLQYGLLTAVCVYLVNNYSSREVSLHVKFWSVLTWVLNFGLALLVPEDVYQTLKGQPDGETV
jgi:hypothetical protein